MENNMLITDKHPFIKISKELIEICKPLELFNIHHFTYQKHCNDGGRINLSNKPNWIMDYYNLNLLQSSLFEAKPSLYKPKYDVWLDDYNLQVYQHGKLYYNTGQSITIAQPQEDGCEFFLFSAAVQDKKSISFLARNMDILYHFICYFKDRAAKLLKKAKSHKIVTVGELERAELVNLTLSDQTFYDLMIDHKRKFFKSTRIYKYTFENSEHKGINLTGREIDCIVHLLNNRTSIQTAEKMHISQRTVEHYLDNIRAKFNCDTKSALYAKLKKYNLPFINC
jgi:DNA-binding CsgD family transcriptional regulator